MHLVAVRNSRNPPLVMGLNWIKTPGYMRETPAVGGFGAQDLWKSPGSGLRTLIAEPAIDTQ